MKSPTEIADLITELKDHFVLSTAGLPLILSPHRQSFMDQVGVAAGDEIDMTLGFGRERYAFQLEPALDRVQRRPDIQFNVVRAWAELAALKVGREMKLNNYFDKRPLFEFLRHVRNAVAHGNRFDVRKVDRPAVFEHHEVREDMNGAVCIGGELKTAEVFALLDEVAVELRDLP